MEFLFCSQKNPKNYVYVQLLKPLSSFQYLVLLISLDFKIYTCLHVSKPILILQRILDVESTYISQYSFETLFL